MTRGLLYFAFLSLLTITSCAQKNKNKEKQSLTSTKQVFPEKPIGYTSDFENIFSQSQVSYLDSLIAQHKKETSNEIAIVTLSLDSTVIKSAAEFDQLCLTLVNKWGIGEKDKHNGIGIIFSTNLKRIRIETGIGLVSKLTDRDAKRIIDTIITPEFKNGDYFTGMVKGVMAISDKIK